MANPNQGQAQKPAQDHRPQHLWVLVHSKKGSDAVIHPFWYEPSKEFPYPATESVIKGMKLQVDIDGGDTVYLEEVPPHSLPAASHNKGHGSVTYPNWIGLGLEPAERDEETVTQVEPQ